MKVSKKEITFRREVYISGLLMGNDRRVKIKGGNFMRKGSLTILTILLIVGVIFAAGVNSTDAQEPKRLIVANFADANSLDPQRVSDTASFWIQNQMYEGLVRRTPDMGVEPALAKDWEFIDDRTIEFYLREGVKFHNGDEFTAEDVLFSYQRLLDPDFGSPGASRLAMVDIDNVEIVDDYTIRIPTKEPFAAILTYLAHSASLIVSKSGVEEHGDAFGENPVGTGPFKLNNWRQGDEVVLDRFDDYWGGPAEVDQLIFRAIPEGTSRTIELETGGVHVSRGIERVDLDRVDNHRNLELHLYEALRINYMGFNHEAEPFNDVRVRQAIAYALDHSEIVQAVYGPLGGPATGYINSNIWAFNPDTYLYPRDIDKAKELMAEAGYADGFTTKIAINDDATRRALAEVVSYQLEQLNIQSSIEVYEWGAYLDMTGRGDHEIYMLAWLASTGDPHHAMHPLFHSSNKGSAGNRQFYDNPQVDELLEKGMVETDMDQRMAFYQEAQQIISEDVGWIPLADDREAVGVHVSVTNFVPCPSGYHMFHKVGLE